jgi:hypothetical protein
VGPAQWDEVAFVCDAGGRPCVVHRCRAKMLYPEDVAPGDTDSNRRLDRLPGEARAWAHWDALLAARPAAEVFGRAYATVLLGPGDSPTATQPGAPA